MLGSLARRYSLSSLQRIATLTNSFQVEEKFPSKVGEATIPRKIICFDQPLKLRGMLENGSVFAREISLRKKLRLITRLNAESR
jgi:hypothetical protein